jgi:hypothetical protein
MEFSNQMDDVSFTQEAWSVLQDDEGFRPDDDSSGGGSDDDGGGNYGDHYRDVDGDNETIIKAVWCDSEEGDNGRILKGDGGHGDDEDCKDVGHEDGKGGSGDGEGGDRMPVMVTVRNDDEDVEDAEVRNSKGGMGVT